jgi:hypothetical protein
MNEAFSTPDGPEDLIVECEGCKNLIYVRGDYPDKISPCPICGALNKLEMSKGKQVNGRLILRSEILNMNKDLLEQGRVSLPGLPEKVQEALLWLQEHEWSFGFTIEEEDEDVE